MARFANRWHGPCMRERDLFAILDLPQEKPHPPPGFGAHRRGFHFSSHPSQRFTHFSQNMSRLTYCNRIIRSKNTVRWSQQRTRRHSAVATTLRSARQTRHPISPAPRCSRPAVSGRNRGEAATCCYFLTRGGPPSKEFPLPVPQKIPLIDSLRSPFWLPVGSLSQPSTSALLIPSKESPSAPSQAAITDRPSGESAVKESPGATGACNNSRNMEKSSCPHGAASSWSQVLSYTFMKKILPICFASVALLSQVSFAQEATTTPVGAVTVALKANSDTLVSFPFPRSISNQGSVQSIVGNLISITPDSPMTPNQYVYQAGVQPNTYYIQVKSGGAKGQYSTVAGNSDTSITTEFEPDILASVSAGDRVAIYPYWTLGTVFPASDAGLSFVSSTSNLGSGRRTEILVPNAASVGVNKPAGSTYYFNGFWRLQGSISANRNDDVLLPDSYMIVRGNNYSSDTELRFTGAVTEYQAISITSATILNDNQIGLPIPKNVTLDGLQLFQQAAFAASTSNLGSGRRDELLVYDSTSEIASKNRPSKATFYYNGFWRKQGEVGTNQNTTVIPAGSILVIRKYPTATAQVYDWLYSLN